MHLTPQHKRLVQLIDEFDEIFVRQPAESADPRSDRQPARPRQAHRPSQRADPGRLADSVAEHERIIQAITDGDPEAGARTMRAHILSVQAQQLALSEPVVRCSSPAALVAGGRFLVRARHLAPGRGEHARRRHIRVARNRLSLAVGRF